MLKTIGGYVAAALAAVAFVAPATGTAAVAACPHHGIRAEDGSCVNRHFYDAPDWQGGLARHSEVWWTGQCFLDWPAIHVGRTPLHGHFDSDLGLVWYPFEGRDHVIRYVVWDGVNLTNNLHRSIEFAAACG